MKPEKTLPIDSRHSCASAHLPCKRRFEVYVRDCVLTYISCRLIWKLVPAADAVSQNDEMAQQMEHNVPNVGIAALNEVAKNEIVHSAHSLLGAVGEKARRTRI